jgi:acetyl/propionyl-CoA carboxylase alpha subunit
VRIDTFAHSECTIPPYYDSMIAKIIVHGRDRQEAIARMRRTLEMTVIEGIKTSIPLHLKDPRRAGFHRRAPQHVVHGPVSDREEAHQRHGSRRGRVVVRHAGRTVLSIVDADVCRDRGLEPRSLALACLHGGARVVQLRVKSGSSARFLDLATEIVDAAGTFGAAVIVNDRADIARMAEPPAFMWDRTICRRTRA